jgi:hypothetical protein
MDPGTGILSWVPFAIRLTARLREPGYRPRAHMPNGSICAPSGSSAFSLGRLRVAIHVGGLIISCLILRYRRAQIGTIRPELAIAANING